MLFAGCSGAHLRRSGYDRLKLAFWRDFGAHRGQRHEPVSGDCGGSGDDARIPAIVGLGLGLGEAFSYSFGRVMAKPFSYLGYYIAANFLAGLGALACGIGIILTLPILYVAMAVLVTGIIPFPMQGDPGAYPRYPEQPSY